jgi:SAM-dependent methyltransferase
MNESRRPVRPRAALTHQGGDVEIWGDERPAVMLADALLASTGPAGRYTHGFHTYPARMHPGIAAEVIERFTGPGNRVLDPFCGSGTVLVEALLAGRLVAGADLSPLALRIAEAHVARPNADQRGRFIKTLE